MSLNNNLNKARKEKNDEFYTLLSDIEKELKNYKQHFEGKSVYCNCDDPVESNFWVYFDMNFDLLKLKSLVSTHYDTENEAYKLELKRDENGNKIGPFKTIIGGNGDFRSKESIEILKESDMVVTNPPFSCFSSDTEVMTDKGWKLIKNVDIKNDIIMSLNPNTNEIEMVNAIDFIKNPVNGELYNYHNQNMDFCVTGNHRMVVYGNSKKNKDSLVFIDADKVKKSHRCPLQGFKWNGVKKEYFYLPETTQNQQFTRKKIVVPKKEIKMNDWLEFLGFYLADGCYRDRINVLGHRDYSISIKQNVSNEKYVLDLINRIGFKATISNGSSQTNKNYSIYSKQLWDYLSKLGRSSEKYIPRNFLNLEKSQLEILLKGYMNGDSSRCADGHIHYSSVSKRLMENVQELLLKVYGLTTQIRKATRKHSYDEKFSTCYNINVNLDRRNMNFTKYGVANKVKYNDYVYCLTLERNHIMLVRHNEIIGWCGNCFREYVAQLMEYNKKFLIIGNVNAITYKEIFPLIKNNEIWLGQSIHSGDREFAVPDSYPLNASGVRIDEFGNKYIRVKGVRWFTNLNYIERNEELILFEKYYDYYDKETGELKPHKENKYPKYDNYNAINIDKVSDIPLDYEGIMGVPITFLDKYNPNQFEIIKCSAYSLEKNYGCGSLYVDKNKKYARILIKRRIK